jgi:tungstate transport system substrate-binding protein
VNNNWEVTVSLDDLPGGVILPLLAGIKETGSLSRAARKAGVSYRYAWSLLNKLEKTLNQQLLVRKAGGYAGGGSELTDSGLRVLSYLLELRQETRLQLAALLHGLPPREKGGRQLVVASSMEPVVTGLLDVLEQAYLQETGTVVRHVAAGSGQALELAKAGRADLCLTHAPELEEKFVAAGWGTRRLPVMVNDYVLAGPADDPAGVCGTTSVVTALQKIAAGTACFVSRSDLSGTNLLELKLWQEAGIAPAGEPWYRECRSVLGSYGVLQQASELQAYTLVDRASFLAGHGGTALKICLEGDRLLVNVFSVLPVSALKTGVDQEGAEQFADWLTGMTAQSTIAGFGRHNFACSLFKPVNLSRQTA